MRYSFSASLLLWLSLAERVVSSPREGSQQLVLSPPANDEPSAADADVHTHTEQVHAVDDAILAALNAHDDPVDALISLQPESAAELFEARLIHVFGEPKPEWMKEADKLRLRRQGKKFMDITNHQDLYAEPMHSWAGEASTCAHSP